MASSFPQCKNGEYINEATAEDIPDIRKMVDKAYSKYIDRIGKPPAPMTEDYHSEIEENSVYVLKDNSGSLIGLLVLVCRPESGTMEIKNLVVDPKAQGHGYVRVLMNHADSMALSHGIHTIELYTNVKMYENITLYAKLGFSEVERRIENGFERVYFRKELSHK
ncbi:acetyltransferase [Penicillium citrinum]|uniref:Acetyltransferase n=1 Tax=Penicillium citrinum TaxID=5077 RepID=A0A9W9TV79_PENCI|nr:acetyltransferase [Penicillium citrinum]KAJ5242621.1 acetyltransferase [Penicillium citrinum]